MSVRFRTKKITQASKMGTAIHFIMCAMALLSTASFVTGQSTDSPSALTSVALLDEVTSVVLPNTPDSELLSVESSTVSLSDAPPNSEISGTEPIQAMTVTQEMVTDVPERNGTAPPVTMQSPVQGQTVATPSVETVTPSALPDNYTSFLPDRSVGSRGPTPTPWITVSPNEEQTVLSFHTIPTTQESSASPLPSSTTNNILLTETSAQTFGPVEPSNTDDVPSELDVGDEDSDKVPHHPSSPLDPILAALVSIFIICTAMASVLLFLRFRQRTEHPEFHRLQDLPMDDLMEDTPLSRHTY